MNKADYKIIAEIYKLRLKDIRNSNVHTQEEKDLLEYHILALINAHADYFEKEDKEVNGHNDKNTLTFELDFDRKQFLKECGVE